MTDYYNYNWYKSTTVRNVFLARSSSPAPQTSAESLYEYRFSPFFLHEHLVNRLKVSWAQFVYAQTHIRAAAQLMSITLEAGTYQHGRTHSFCLVHSKPHCDKLSQVWLRKKRGRRSKFGLWGRRGKVPRNLFVEKNQPGAATISPDTEYPKKKKKKKGKSKRPDQIVQTKNVQTENPNQTACAEKGRGHWLGQEQEQVANITTENVSSRNFYFLTIDGSRCVLRVVSYQSK